MPSFKTTTGLHASGIEITTPDRAHRRHEGLIRDPRGGFMAEPVHAEAVRVTRGGIGETSTRAHGVLRDIGDFPLYDDFEDEPYLRRYDLPIDEDTDEVRIDTEEHDENDDVETLPPSQEADLDDIDWSLFHKNPAELDLFLQRIAKELEEIYLDAVEISVKNMKEVFANNRFGRFIWRAKSYQSILNKLRDEVAEGHFFKNLAEAELWINDGIGISLILKDTSPAGTARFLRRFFYVIDTGLVEVLRVRNYHGEKTNPYIGTGDVMKIALCTKRITDREIKLIKSKSEEEQACHNSSKQEILVLIDRAEIKKSGFTSLQIDLLDIDGNHIDFHIRGEFVNRVAFAEHFSYSCREGKIDPDHIEDPELKSFAQALKNLTPEQRKLYNDYLESYYQYAIERDLGFHPDRPEVPSQFQHDLFDLEALHLSLVKNKLVKSDSESTETNS